MDILGKNTSIVDLLLLWIPSWCWWCFQGGIIKTMARVWQFLVLPPLAWEYFKNMRVHHYFCTGADIFRGFQVSLIIFNVYSLFKTPYYVSSFCPQSCIPCFEIYEGYLSFLRSYVLPHFLSICSWENSPHLEIWIILICIGLYLKFIPWVLHWGYSHPTCSIFKYSLPCLSQWE